MARLRQAGRAGQAGRGDAPAKTIGRLFFFFFGRLFNRLIARRETVAGRRLIGTSIGRPSVARRRDPTVTRASQLHTSSH